MSYTVTRTDREVTYERDLDDRIDMYLYFNKRGRHINGDHGVQPEDLLEEVIRFIEFSMVPEAKSGPIQQAKALELVLGELKSAQMTLNSFRKDESTISRSNYVRSKK